MVDEYGWWVTTVDKGSIEIDLDKVDLYIVKDGVKQTFEEYFNMLMDKRLNKII